MVVLCSMVGRGTRPVLGFGRHSIRPILTEISVIVSFFKINEYLIVNFSRNIFRV